MKLKYNATEILTKDGISFVVPFILITSCFALWGFATDMTNPIVKAYSKIFRMGATEGALVQVAYYLGYFVMAFPAAIFIQRYTFKKGVMLGLSLFIVGSLLFIPAKMLGFYYPFLLAYFILTCGLSFLETSCNPYIYCMGSEETATQRLNLAQAFNPIGALLGMYVVKETVMNQMDPMSTEQRYELTEAQFNMVKDHDLSVLIGPYLGLGVFCVILLILIRLHNMPTSSDTAPTKDIKKAMKELLQIRNYRYGVISQFFYMGAQVTCWTFIIQYGTRVFQAEGMEEKAAELLSMSYNIGAMALFTVSRFVCTWFLRFVQPSRLLSVLAILAISFTAGAILFPDRNGLYCLVGVSACMSLMFPTIYGIALHGVGENVKFAGAGLIMGVLGGSFFPPLQGLILDSDIQIFGVSSTNLSFIVPLICFIVVAFYGHYSYVRQYILQKL